MNSDVSYIGCDQQRPHRLGEVFFPPSAAETQTEKSSKSKPALEILGFNLKNKGKKPDTAAGVFWLSNGKLEIRTDKNG